MAIAVFEYDGEANLNLEVGNGGSGASALNGGSGSSGNNSRVEIGNSANSTVVNNKRYKH